MQTDQLEQHTTEADNTSQLTDLNEISALLYQQPSEKIKRKSFDITQAIQGGQFITYLNQTFPGDVATICELLRFCVKHLAITQLNVFKSFNPENSIVEVLQQVSENATVDEIRNIAAINHFYAVTALFYRMALLQELQANDAELSTTKEQVQQAICGDNDTDINFASICQQYHWKDLSKIFSPKQIKDAVDTNVQAQTIEAVDLIEDILQTIPQNANYTKAMTSLYEKILAHFETSTKLMPLMIAIAMQSAENRGNIINLIKENQIAFAENLTDVDAFRKEILQIVDIHPVINKPISVDEIYFPCINTPLKARAFLITLLFTLVMSGFTFLLGIISLIAFRPGDFQFKAGIVELYVAAISLLPCLLLVVLHNFSKYLNNHWQVGSISIAEFAAKQGFDIKCNIDEVMTALINQSPEEKTEYEVHFEVEEIENAKIMANVGWLSDGGGGSINDAAIPTEITPLVPKSL